MKDIKHIKGALWGSAIGDGLGYKVEFKSFEEIQALWPSASDARPMDNPIRVTDDTQMMLALGRALQAVSPDYDSVDNVREHIIHEFIVWLNDPENNRAPGMTCLSACEKLETGIAWQEATVKNSKGCGANMRVLPLGFMARKGLSTHQIAGLAQLQSAVTHAHPTALAASDLTAMAIHYLLAGVQASELLDVLMGYAHSQQCIYHSQYLSDIWMRPGVMSTETFIQRGWEACIAILQEVKNGLPRWREGADPCTYTGAGWVAEEALGTALFSFLLSPESFVEVIHQRSARSSGDSDSIACIAGALAGAYLGIEAIPKNWVDRTEYKKELEDLARFFL